MFESVIKSVLSGLYTNLVPALILAVLFMVIWKYVKVAGWKKLIKNWIKEFRTSNEFRLYFFLALVVSLILFRTILCRSVWSSNPLKNVIGIWGIKDENGALYTEGIQNSILFIPFSVFFLLVFHNKKRKYVRTIIVSFGFSLTIEMLQLFLRCGEFQLSDIFYNTLGSMIGVIILWLVFFVRKKRGEEIGKTETDTED